MRNANSSLRWLMCCLALLAFSFDARAQDFDALLRGKPYFKTIVWTTDASFAPFEILVQRQAVPVDGYEKSIVQFFGPWLLSEAKVFDEQIVARAQLPPGGNPQPIRLIVLGTQGDFINYSKTIQNYDSLDQVSYYDDRIHAVITYWDVSGSVCDRRHSALRRLVFALLQQRSTAFGERQAPL